MNSSTPITTPTPPRQTTPPKPGKKLPTWLRHVDETAKAQFVIDAWLALDPASRDASLARLIAATLHDGPDTALGRFASSGQLDAEGALLELNDVVVPLEREPWLDALGRYIIAGGYRR